MDYRYVSHWRSVMLVGVLLSATVGISNAADPSEKPADTDKDKNRPAEIAEMLWAIVGGSQMGPGDGWFHPGQSRYSWDWLAERFDSDHDGIITREEFKGPSYLFDRLDANHDGVLTKWDFDWSQSSALMRQGMMAGQWFRRIDSNSNGRISKEEWNSYSTGSARGRITSRPDALAGRSPTPRRPVRRSRKIRPRRRRPTAPLP